MKSPLKILVIEQDCGQLIALTIWLTQFPEWQVTGSMSKQYLKLCLDEPGSLKYDLIVYGLQINNSEEIPLELALDLSLIRKIKTNQSKSAVILLTNNVIADQINGVIKQMVLQLQKESDACLLSQDALRDLHSEIMRLTSLEQSNFSRRRMARAG